MTTITPGFIDASSGAPTYDAAAMRIITAFGLCPDGSDALSVTAGVRPGAGLAVSLASGDWQVAPGAAVIVLPGAQGAYVAAVTAQETGAVTAADATNPRKDLVQLRVYDDEIDGTGKRECKVEYVEGTAGVSPAAPTVDDGALGLGVITVPASGTGSASADDIRPTTVAAGGVLPCSAYPDSPFTGQLVWRTDSDTLEGYDSTGTWRKFVAEADWTDTTATGSTNWTVNNLQYKVQGSLIMLSGQVTYSGNKITVGSDGNISDNLIIASGLIPSDALPVNQDVFLCPQQSGFPGWFVRLRTNGEMTLTAGVPGNSLSSGNSLWFNETYGKY